MSAAPGLIIAAPASGSGKTTVTLGLLRSLARRDVRIASAKVGPDYIDPAFHSAATGRPCLNLDHWAMRRAVRHSLIGKLQAGSDLIVCEGAMGLFDGATATSGSTADIAAETGWPVILIIDVQAQAASAAAVLRGFASHRPGVSVDGVIFNRVGGPQHVEIIGTACRDTLPDIPIIGYLPNDEGMTLSSRHLGLVQASEHPELDTFLEAAANLMERHLDMSLVREIARPSHIDTSAPVETPLRPLGQRIAVARDTAFAFGYPAVLDGWRAAGAELSPFSPLADEPPDAAADAVYLPGGYPELYAGVLSRCSRFLGGLRAAATRGAAILGECGGYMVLGRTLVDKDGVEHEMAGLLPVATSFANPTLHLGCRRMTLTAACPLGAAGQIFRGHEFHHSTVLSEGPGRALFAHRDADNKRLGFTGLLQGNVMGSFLHLIDQECEVDEEGADASA